MSMLYFAYGSNLNCRRMYERCPNTYIIGRASLDDYELVFQNNNAGRIVANLRFKKGASVEGVIYEIDDAEIYNLDKAEGHPVVYKREKVIVDFNGTLIKVMTYIMPQIYFRWKTCKMVSFKRKNGIPKREYLEHILKGYEIFNIDDCNLMKIVKEEV